MNRLASATADQRGMVLPLTLMFVIILTTLSTALLAVGGQETLIAANHLKGVHARFLAEAGLEDAFNRFRNNTTLLTSSPPSSLTTLTGLSGPGSTLTAYGGYTVQYQSAGTDTVRVVVTGYTGTSGSPTATRVLRAILTVGFTNSDAVRTNSNLAISGTPTITGTCGSVHTDNNLTISDTPSVGGTATAHQLYSVSGTPTVGSGSGGGKPKKTIPTITPSNFLTRAKQTVAASEVYQFLSDGKVRDGNDALITTLIPEAEYRGWRYSSVLSANGVLQAKWEFGGNTAYDGTYYFQGNVKVSGSPGTSATPWNVTIIAVNDLEVSGSPHFNVHSLDSLLVAGDDLLISGNFEMHQAGAILARADVWITALIGPTITGYIVGQGGSGAIGNLNIGGNKISGNPTITYNCGLNPPVVGDLTILAAGF